MLSEATRFLIQRYCSDGAAVNCLPAVAGVAAVGINNPRLVVPESKNLWAKFSAESAADTGVHINFRHCHNARSFLVVRGM